MNYYFNKNLIIKKIYSKPLNKISSSPVTLYTWSSHWKKKRSHFDLKSWFTGETKIQPGIPSNWRIFESNYSESLFSFHQWLNFLGQNDSIFSFSLLWWTFSSSPWMSFSKKRNGAFLYLKRNRKNYLPEMRGLIKKSFFLRRKSSSSGCLKF